MSKSISDESVISPNDAVGEVLGKEHSGEVRCLGFGIVPTWVFIQTRPRFSGMNTSSVSCRSSNWRITTNYWIKVKQITNKMVNNHNQMMVAFKSYMIMKEGKLSKKFVGLFVAPPTMVHITFTFSLPETLFVY